MPRTEAAERVRTRPHLTSSETCLATNRVVELNAEMLPDGTHPHYLSVSASRRGAYRQA